jgi:hypothetical protein
MKALLALVLIAACGCPQKPAPSPTTPAPAPTPAQGPAPDPGSAAGPGSAAEPGAGSGAGSGSASEPTPSWPRGPVIGENCGPNDACAKGLTCVSYYGIAGARGPQFKTCEIKCAADADCPADHKCITIADGPGQVCRK